MRELKKEEVKDVAGGAVPQMTDHPGSVLEPTPEAVPDFNPPVQPA